MKEHLRVCFRSAVILVTLQKTVQAQPSLLTGIPNGRANFVGIGDLAYFTSANFLGRTGTTARETMVPTVRFVTGTKSFMEFNDLLISATSALQRRSSAEPLPETIQQTSKSFIGTWPAMSSLAAIKWLTVLESRPPALLVIRRLKPGSYTT